MPGYAFPVGATTTEYPAKSISFLVTDKVPSTATLIYTASSKTRVNSVLAIHTGASDTGILPISLYVGRDVSGSIVKHLVNKTRVLKTAYLVLPLVSGDTRVGEDGNPTSIGYNKISNEITLQTGEKLYATCPFEDVIELTIELSEGVK
jgi:hypothetical protein